MASNKVLKDIHGRTYAKLSDLKPGMKLEADGNFTCLDEGEIVEVKVGVQGKLYVPCHNVEDEEGVTQHYLEGQLDDYTHEYLIGLYPVGALCT